MKKKSVSPKANPQMWANGEHLDRIAAEQGIDASTEEFKRMFAEGGKLPPIEERHVAKANSYRRWNGLLLLGRPWLKEQQEKYAASADHASAEK